MYCLFPGGMCNSKSSTCSFYGYLLYILILFYGLGIKKDDNKVICVFASLLQP